MLSDNLEPASLAATVPANVLADVTANVTACIDASVARAETLAAAHAGGLTHASDALNLAFATAGTPLCTVARPQSLADEAHRQLLLQLDLGLWKAGAKLPPEKALADALGVSRPIVREALARLKADGRIESRQGSGAFVAERNKIAAFRLTESAGDTRAEGADVAADIAERELLELRQIVEAGAAELAAQRRSAADLAAIGAALADMTSALAAEADGADADDRFHTAIAAATHNAQITRFVEFLGAQFSASRKVTWQPRAYAEGIAQVRHSDHSAILAAIAASDAPRAKALAHGHVQRALDFVLARIAGRDAGTAAGQGVAADAAPIRSA